MKVVQEAHIVNVSRISDDHGSSTRGRVVEYTQIILKHTNIYFQTYSNKPNYFNYETF